MTKHPTNSDLAISLVGDIMVAEVGDTLEVHTEEINSEAIHTEEITSEGNKTGLTTEGRRALIECIPSPTKTTTHRFSISRYRCRDQEKGFLTQ